MDDLANYEVMAQMLDGRAFVVDTAIHSSTF